MIPEPEPDLTLEIAHVLLLDVVGYSRLLVDDQIVLLGSLNRIVRSTREFVQAESSGKLIRLPTGDGMALLFFDNPETPAHCALGIARAAQAHEQIRLRMGIHSGPIKKVLDVNDRSNVAGAGIDIAQRVLDCGDAGHILLSQRAADDLRPYRHWNACLQDLGICEVKHGERLRIFNLCKDELGNPKLPEKIRRQQRRSAKLLAAASHAAAASPAKKAGVIAAFCAALLLVLGGGGWLVWKTIAGGRGGEATLDSPHQTPKKSIAVLPFTNLSDDRQNAYFAEGVQDEILTNLAKIADLKVISRSSVMTFKESATRDRRKIGQALGVANVLEGTVQRDGQRVRITTQLIEAASDRQIWADRYDRELSDVFAIQTEVAEKVAQQLKARLSSEEKALIEEQPTNNLEAYEFYVRGKALLASTTFTARAGEIFAAGVRLLEQAVAIDPDFFLAYYQLAGAHDQMFWFGVDHTEARLALADAALKNMTRLRPDAGETHLALGQHLYWGYRDYTRARAEFELARRALPNNPRPILLTAYIDRRQGRFEDALRRFHRARALDPRDLNILQQIALTYQPMRRFEELTAILDRALEIAPDDPGTRVRRAAVELEWRANPAPLREAIHALVAPDPTAASSVAEQWLSLALREHDPAEAERALAVMTAEGCTIEGVVFPRDWCVGQAARARGDRAGAEAAFRSAREEAEATVQKQPDYAEALSVLGVIDAALGNKEAAIQAGQRAVEMLPLTEDAIDGAILLENLALIYTWTGEHELALEKLAATIAIPSQLSYGQLRLHPNWDPLRGQPRFEALVASLAPK